jgi:hypothetical protein
MALSAVLLYLRIHTVMKNEQPVLSREQRYLIAQGYEAQRRARLREESDVERIEPLSIKQQEHVTHTRTEGQVS